MYTYDIIFESNNINKALIFTQNTVKKHKYLTSYL